MKFFTFILSLILMVAGTAFAFLNDVRVPVNYLLGKTELPLAAVAFWSLSLGVGLTLLVLGVPMIRLKLTCLSLQRQLKKREEQQGLAVVSQP